jgi:isopropylmalate/homocitrate/citramalate synthase
MEIGTLTAAAWKKMAQGEKPFSPFNFEVIGRRIHANIVLGKKSGRHSIMLKAKELNLPIPTEEKAIKMLEKVKQLSTEKRRLISEEEFTRIYREIGA